MQNTKISTSPQTVEDMLNTAIQQVEAVIQPRWKQVEEKVRQSPTKAVLIAAGIGYVLHRLPLRSLLATQLKVLWALAPPAVMAVAAGKGLHALNGCLHNDGLPPQTTARSVPHSTPLFD